MMENVNSDELKQSLQSLRDGDFKIRGWAKRISYGVIITTFLVGIVGSFEAVGFDMASFATFLPPFGFIFVPLLISIGVNSAIEKHEKAKILAKEEKQKKK